MTNLFHCVCRFDLGPRYGFSYSASPENRKRASEFAIGDSFTHLFSLATPESRTGQSFIEAYRDLDPRLEWPDFLGNGLFVVFYTGVLYRALLSPEGFWVLFLILLVPDMGFVQVVVAHCRLAWRARFSRRDGALSRFAGGCGATRRVMSDTSPLPGWRMRFCAPVCERLCCQPLAQVPISYAISLPRAVSRHFATADSA